MLFGFKCEGENKNIPTFGKKYFPALIIIKLDAKKCGKLSVGTLILKALKKYVPPLLNSEKLWPKSGLKMNWILTIEL
jgi:hypothetical protein